MRIQDLSHEQPITDLLEADMVDWKTRLKTKAGKLNPISKQSRSEAGAQDALESEMNRLYRAFRPFAKSAQDLDEEGPEANWTTDLATLKKFFYDQGYGKSGDVILNKIANQKVSAEVSDETDKLAAGFQYGFNFDENSEDGDNLSLESMWHGLNQGTLVLENLEDDQPFVPRDKVPGIIKAVMKHAVQTNGMGAIQKKAQEAEQEQQDEQDQGNEYADPEVGIYSSTTTERIYKDLIYFYKKMVNELGDDKKAQEVVKTNFEQLIQAIVEN